METNKPSEGHETKLNRDKQLSSGQRNLIPSNETKMKSPQPSKSPRRRTRTSKQVKIIDTPIETPVHEETIQEPLKEMDDKSQKLLEATPLMVPNSVSELTEENWVRSLWEEVRKAKETVHNKENAPITEIDLEKKQAHFDLTTRYADTQSSSSNASKASGMKELPSFINPEGSDNEVLMLPSQYHPSPMVMDTANIQTFMSTPVMVTLTLAEILKVKPKLWQEVTTCLGQEGVQKIKTKPNQMPRDGVGKVKCELVPINKVGDYCEGEDSNTTLPVEFNEVKSMAILDSGAGVAIATKDVWDA